MWIVSPVTDKAKRLILGRELSSEQLGETLLPKKIALPVFASDALSSNAYETQEILLVLSLGGVAFYKYAPWVALLVIFIYSVVVASYRQNVHAYPSGGGDVLMGSVVTRDESDADARGDEADADAERVQHRVLHSVGVLGVRNLQRHELVVNDRHCLTLPCGGAGRHARAGHNS